VNVRRLSNSTPKFVRHGLWLLQGGEERKQIKRATMCTPTNYEEFYHYINIELSSRRTRLNRTNSLELK